MTDCVCVWLPGVALDGDGAGFLADFVGLEERED